MRLQHMILIFLVIVLPMALILSQYTGLQIDILDQNTKYDTALLAAAYDTMSAFDLNTVNTEASSVIGEEIRDLEAVISTFTRSLATSMGIAGASDDYILGYVPAMVFGMYDGYYIYSRNSQTDDLEIKPYVYYSKTYTYGSTNLTICFSLDNYVSIYGTYNGKNISAAGYLIVPDDVSVSDKFTYVTSDGTTSVVGAGTKADNAQSWVQYRELDILPETIYENVPIKSDEDGTVEKNQSEISTDAMMYYYEALEFTKLYNEAVGKLKTEDKEVLLINNGNDPEDENSAIMNEKINVIKDSITSSLNTALYTYEGSVIERYEMPQLSGEDWEKILNNISITAFLKDIPIGGTKYNNYVVVNSTTNQKYASSQAIDFIRYDSSGNSKGYYHKITCEDLIEQVKNGASTDTTVGYASVDFERYRYIADGTDAYYYYYKHNEYADYACEVETKENSVNVATIGSYIDNLGLSATLNKKLLTSYYSAVGRIRYKLVKASSYINMTEAKEFTVKYYSNGGTWNGASDPQTATTTTGKTTAISGPTRQIYTFLGWSTNQSAVTAEIKAGDTIYAENDLTLYAVWAREYAITYYSNGAEYKQDTKLQNIDYEITSSKPTMENKVFLGWAESSGATVAEYQAGDIYSGNIDLDLYAVWTDRLVTVSYYNGIIKVDSTDVAVNGNVTVDVEVEEEGNTFLGWVDDAGNTYNIGDTIYSLTDNLKLNAKWGTTTYTVTYDANGGDKLEGRLIDSNWNTVNYGYLYIIPEDTPTWDGYTFKGWSTVSTDVVGDENYAPGAAIGPVFSDIVLYAIWEGQEYTIVYDANGGENAPESQTAQKTTSIKITTQTPTRTGYDFVGWSTSSDATEAQYSPGDTYGASATDRTSIKLYAIWKTKTFTIAYNANGGSGAPDNQTKKTGQTIKLSSTKPTKDGYYFMGWSKTQYDSTTNINDRRVDYYAGSTYSADEDITLYAVWSGDLYEIAYSANGGSGAPESQTEEYNTTVTLSTEQPTRSGYNFLGWSTSSDATEAEYNPGDTYTVTGNLLLYAVWSLGEHVLTINPNGGTYNGSTATQTVGVETYDVLWLDPPTRSGYEFLYWECTSGDAEVYGDEYGAAILIGTQNATITAKYARLYTLTYNENATDSVSGMPSPTSVQYTNGTSITLPSGPTRTGYTFNGWSTNKNATSGTAAGGTYTMPASDTTLYAIWKANTYTLTYNANGGVLTGGDLSDGDAPATKELTYTCGELVGPYYWSASRSRLLI